MQTGSTALIAEVLANQDEIGRLCKENYFLRDKARAEVHRALNVVESLAGEGMTQKARVVVDSVIRRLREQEQNLTNPSRDRADT